MAGIGQPQHVRTGHRAIDCVAYRHEPARMVFAEAAREVLLYRINDYGESTTTKAERPADDHELLLLTRGSGLPGAGRIAGERFTIAPNRDLRVSFIPQGADAAIEFGSSAKSINVLFPKGYLGSMIMQQEPREFAPLLFADNGPLADLIALLELELFRSGLASDVVIDQAIRSMALIMSGLSPLGFAAESERVTITAKRLRSVVDFIEESLSETITIECLAHLAGVSMFHFSRVFRNATGLSPYRYVCERRMFKAQRLLIATELPISDISAVCGFPRHSNFSAAFARARGIAPNRYRALFRL